MAVNIENTIASAPLSVVVATFLFIYVAISSLTSRAKVPRELPWVGKKGGGPFSEFLAAIECLWRQRENLREGYEKYLRKGQSYIFPTLNGASEIIIPHEKLRWLLDFKDSEASVAEAHFDMLAGDYAFTHPILLHETFHDDVIHRNVSRKAHLLIPITWDEIKYQVDLNLGSDTKESKEIPVLKTMTAVVAAVSNRMFVGLPLCRNLGFRELNMRFAKGVMLVIMTVQMFPRFLQPIAGHIAAIPNHICFWQTKRYTVPLIKQRLADIEREEANPTTTEKSQIPEDYLTWQIRLAKQHGVKREYNPDWVARRLMPMEFAAIHTSSFTITNVLFDLLASDPKLGYMQAIRDEIEHLYVKNKGVWSKQVLAQMLRTDSAIRESMRVSCFGVRGVHRKVLAKEGLKGEDGWTAPYGSIVATDVWTRHHDETIYPNAYAYDAFRFSRPREECGDDQTSEHYLKMQNLSLISTGDTFLPFGHGRHACPGRFFINIEMKLLLAYLLMNYDFELLKERPANTMMGEVVIPPTKETIRFKRRSHTVMDGIEA